MSISKFQAQFQPRAALVDSNGLPTTSYGFGLIRALWLRTGGGTGIVPQVSDPITATGTTINDAFQLSDDWNLVTVVPLGAGVAISSELGLQPGNDIWVYNSSANDLSVYPPSNAIIDQLAVGVPYNLLPNRLRCFQCWQSTLFLSYGN